MQLSQLFILYTTVSSLQDAERIAQEAIANRLAGCVNIIPGLISVYRWEGVIEKGTEYGLIFKTTEECHVDLRAWLVDVHPYKNPAILSGGVESTQIFHAFIWGNVAGSV